VRSSLALTRTEAGDVKYFVESTLAHCWHCIAGTIRRLEISLRVSFGSNLLFDNGQ